MLVAAITASEVYTRSLLVVANIEPFSGLLSNGYNNLLRNTENQTD